jgi:hypothetical protein
MLLKHANNFFLWQSSYVLCLGFLVELEILSETKKAAKVHYVVRIVDLIECRVVTELLMLLSVPVEIPSQDCRFVSTTWQFLHFLGWHLDRLWDDWMSPFVLLDVEHIELLLQGVKNWVNVLRHFGCLYLDSFETSNFWFNLFGETGLEGPSLFLDWPCASKLRRFADNWRGGGRCSSSWWLLAFFQWNLNYSNPLT